jgi:hypothetical protein
MVTGRTQENYIYGKPRPRPFGHIFNCTVTIEIWMEIN